jgi:hypothetical protein
VVFITFLLWGFYEPFSLSIPPGIKSAIGYNDLLDYYFQHRVLTIVSTFILIIIIYRLNEFIIKLLINHKYENKLFLARVKFKLLINDSRIKAILGITILIIILILMTVIPARLGYYAAEDLIRGNCDHYEMNLSVTNNSSQFYCNMILITQCNGNYYLINKTNSTFLNISENLYIVPERTVLHATIKKCRYNELPTPPFLDYIHQMITGMASEVKSYLPRLR